MPTRIASIAVATLATTLACTTQHRAPAKDTASPAAATASTDVGSVRQSIEAANASQFAAIQKGDTAGATMNYGPDATFMMTGEKIKRGHDEIAKWMSDMFGHFAFKDAKIKTDDLIVSGELAVETGTYEWTLQPKKGAPVKDVGKYLTVWKRQTDGGWKIVRDIANSDLPAK